DTLVRRRKQRPQLTIRALDQIAAIVAVGQPLVGELVADIEELVEGHVDIVENLLERPAEIGRRERPVVTLHPCNSPIPRNRCPQRCRQSAASRVKASTTPRYWGNWISIIVMDNYANHKTPNVARPPGRIITYTSTSASWINKVERWFAH